MTSQYGTRFRRTCGECLSPITRKHCGLTTHRIGRLGAQLRYGRRIELLSENQK